MHLKEVQSGCLSNVNSSCQDIAIANALIHLTRNFTSSEGAAREDVVCFRILQEFSFGIGGGFKYKCCGAGKLGNGNRIPDCDLDIQESKWLAVFNAILALVVGAVFLYWPLLLCAIPDSFFKEDHESCQTNDLEDQIALESLKIHRAVTGEEGTFYDHDQSSPIGNSYFETIPIDDLSPITLVMMIRNSVKMLPTLSHGFHVKLFLIWYCVIPIFFYIKIVLYFIIKGNHFNDASKKLLFQVADFYLNVFSS